MALNLSKNKTINLTKSVPQQNEYSIGLAWDEAGDLDASAVLIKDGKRIDLVYYRNEEAKGIKHSGDALDGYAEGDDEVIELDLSKVDADKVIIAITSYESGSFGAANNPVARLYKKGETSSLIECNLDSEAAFGTSLELVEFTKNGNEWEFKNLSEMVGTSENGLQDIVDKYAA